MKMFNCNLGGNLSGESNCKAPKVVGFALLGIMGATALISGVSLIVKSLWNKLMPEIFGLKTINLHQAFGLTILAKILFGSGGFSHSHNGGKPKKKYIKKEVVIEKEVHTEDKPEGDVEEPEVS